MSAYSLPREVVLKQVIARREGGLARLAAKHAKERAEKEQALLAAKAELEALLKDEEQA